MPKERIPFRYSFNPDWDLQILANNIFQKLRASTVPSSTVQIAFLVELIKSMTFTLSEDWKIGELISKRQGEKMTVEELFEFIPENCEEKISSNNLADLSNKYQGLAAWLLIQARLSGDTKEGVKKYCDDLLKRLLAITAGPPMNIIHNDSNTFPKHVTDYGETLENRQIHNLAAIYDYFSLMDPSTLSTKIRFCTMTTRFEDQMGLKYINTIAKVLGKPIDEFLQLLVILPVAEEAKIILTPGMGIDDPKSLAPYARSMDIIDKSSYSTTNNPHFCTVAATLLALTSRSSYLNTVKVPEAIDDCIALAIKIARYLGKRAELGTFIQEDNLENRLKHAKMVLETTPPSVNQLVDQIIFELKAQDGRPSVDELRPLINLAKSIPDRPGTLQQYVQHMIPYNPDRGGR